MEHEEEISFDIILTREFDAVLGGPWLRKQNPRINWRTRSIIFDQFGSEKREKALRP